MVYLLQLNPRPLVIPFRSLIPSIPFVRGGTIGTSRGEFLADAASVITPFGRLSAEGVGAEL